VCYTLTSIFYQVDKAIKDSLSGMVLPERMFMQVDSTCDFIKAFQRPIGVLRVKLVNGRGFPSKTGFMADVPDMYCALEFGSKEWKSSVVKNRSDPEWNETVDFVLSDYGQILDIHVFDKERIRSDIFMGSLQCSAVELLKDGGKKEFTFVPPPDGKKKTRGGAGKITLECELLPFRKDNDLAAPKAETSHPNAIRGMLLVFVSKLTGLPVAKEEAASFVKVKYGDKEFQTSTVSFDPEAAAKAEASADKDGGESAKAIEQSVLNPEYNAVFQIPIDSAIPEDGVNFELMNGKTSLGVHNISKDVFVTMKDELCSSVTNIGGAIMHCGVQVMGLESKDDAPAETGDSSTDA
jgi:C2 domain